MQTLGDQVSGYVARFQAGDAAAEAALRLLRRQVAGLWGAAPFEQVATMRAGEFGAIHQALLASGLADTAPADGEDAASRAWRDALIARWPSPDAAGAFYAATLFLPAHDLGVLPVVDDAPVWLVRDAVNHALASPRLLRRPGEGAQHFAHLAKVVAALDRRFARALSAEQIALEEHVVKRLSILQAYFHDEDVRPLLRDRASLLERFLRRSGLNLEHRFPARADGRLRLGVLAGHFGLHTESFYALAHLEGLDRPRLEVIAYALGASANPIEERCRAAVDAFVVLPAGSIEEQVNRIRADRLDLLLVTTNVTAVTNPITLIAAHRLARTQIATMGSPVTTGFDQIDVFLSSRENEPPDAGTGVTSHYTESLHLLDGALNHFAFQHDPSQRTTTITRATLGVPEDAVVFVSGANFFKIVPELARVWAEILAAVPGSVLVLLPFNPNWSDQYPENLFCRRMAEDFATRGVGIDRLRVVSPLPARADVQGLMRVADVYLDSHPFAGSCSIYDPLSVACPVVAREGAMARSRHGGVMLRMFGVGDLATTSEEAYRDRAIQLGLDRELRAQVRAQLEAALARGNPVLDTRSLATRVSGALVKLAAEQPAREATRRQGRAASLRSALQALGPALARARVRTMRDVEIAERLVLRTFRAAGRTPHLVDVGACLGELAVPFLDQGWTADLFEPDPACVPRLAATLAPFGPRARLHAVAVSDTPSAATTFFQSAAPGLSGMSASPYRGEGTALSVPAVRLDDHLRAQGVRAVDFLKVDAEGADLRILTGHDFTALRPRLVLAEVNSAFAGQSQPDIRRELANMRRLGYQALVFLYDDGGSFARRVWDAYWLTGVVDGAELPHGPIIANVLFYEEDDLAFLDHAVDFVTGALPPEGTERPRNGDGVTTE